MYILGAGSSIAHSRGEFPGMRDFFNRRTRAGILRKHFSDLADYAEHRLGKHIWEDKQTDIEDLFTHLEIDRERRPVPYLEKVRIELLGFIRYLLINLQDKLLDDGGELIDFARKPGLRHPSDTIITFNWDLLLDDALFRRKILDPEGEQFSENNQYWNLVMELSARGEQTINRSILRSPYTERERERGYLLKMHGSVDWFYCSQPDCRAYNKTFPRLNPTKAQYCGECYARLDELIIPPTLNKTYHQYPLLRRIWNLAVEELRVADEIVIWGYSLPPTDYHAIWLLRQGRFSNHLKTLSLIDPAVRDKRFTERFSELFRGKLTTDQVKSYSSYGNYCAGRETLPDVQW